MPTQIDIKGFRSLDDHRQTIPDNPIVVLRGPNGAGKSTIRRVLQRMLGDTSCNPEKDRSASVATARLERDGHEITLKLASRFSVTGSAPIRLAAGEGRLLADLIGPDDDDASTSAPARKARVDALARLAKLEPSTAVLTALTDGRKVDLTGWKKPDDFMEVVGELKRRLEAKARDHKADRDRADGRAAELQKQIAAIPQGEEPADSIESLAADVEAARREVYKLEASVKARAQMETQQEEARGKIVEPTWMQVRANMDIIKTAIDAHDPVDADWAYLDRAINTLFGSIGNAKREAEQHAKLTAILSQPITGATDAEVAQAKSVLDTAIKALTAAQDHARRLALEEQRADAMAAFEAAGIEETAYRAAAKGLSGKIAEMIRAAKLETLNLDDDGDVVANTSAGWVPLASMSFGERVYHAVSALVGTERLDPTSEDDVVVFLVLAPAHWGALDTAARQVLEMDLGRYNGRVVLLTEEPSDDDGIVLFPG